MRDPGNEVGNFAPKFKSTKSNLSPMILVICLCKLLNSIPLVKFRKKAKKGFCICIIANETAEQRREAGEVAAL